MCFPMFLVYTTVYALLGGMLGNVLGLSGADRAIYITAVALASLLLGAFTSAKFYESDERCG